MQRRSLMELERWQRLEAVLDAALTSDPAGWPALLDRSCSGDPELRREVESFLARLDAAAQFLSSAPGALAAAAIASSSEANAPGFEGRRIGAYRIVREIGRGGMARVFLAERADGHFEQQVALKLLRPGLDSDIDHERFRAERQILATLNHPRVARLFDGGVTPDGQPYLILEYVEGEPIDAFCDRRDLSLRDRLDLFVTVAEAVQAAHRCLIVHRDLKPANILVTTTGEVKLLDFGLAKLLDPADDGHGLTRTGQRWMTPAYAAPEQILARQVTTLTDVYQLGVVLYQMLAGRLPFPATDSLRSLEEAVLSMDPALPSSVAMETNVARARQLRGDLDAVVLKAVRKEPERRYSSVDALATDIRRYLDGHPVAARPHTLGYRARRFLRRHLLQTGAVAAIAASLVAGAVISTWQAQAARGQRDRADAVAQESEAVSNLLLGLFTPEDMREAGTDSLTVTDLLSRGMARAEKLRGRPAAHARMLEVTARAYQSVGRHTDAHALWERAVAIRRSVGSGELELAASLQHLSDARSRIGRYAGADTAAREALAIQRALDGPTPMLAHTLHQIAYAAINQGDNATGEAYHRRALRLHESTLGPHDSLTATSRLALGSVLRRQGRPVDAEREYRQALRSFERSLGPEHTDVAVTMLKIAYVLDVDLARHVEAQPFYERALSVLRRNYGEEHPLVAHAMSDISDFHSRRGNHDLAVAMSRRHLEILQGLHGPEHPVVITCTAHTAHILHAAGALDEAEAMLRQALSMERRARGSDHPNVAGLAMNLARLRLDRGDVNEAEILAREAVRIRALVSGESHSNTASAKGLLAVTFARKGNHVIADSLLRAAIASAELQTSSEHRDVRQLYDWLADVNAARKQSSGARGAGAVAKSR